MAVYTQVSAEAMAALLARFDVGELVSAKGIAEGVENSNYLVETDRSKFILTLYEKRVSADDLPFFLSLLDHLAAAGLKVPPAIPDRSGRTIQEVEGRPACLIRFLTGVSLSHPTPAQARAVAVEMGRMHRALADFTGTRANSLGVDAWGPLLAKCGRDLDAIDPTLFDTIEQGLTDVLGRWRNDGDRLAIHADLFPDNVLTLGDKVTGLIDFYFACTDLRLYDLAVMHSAWSFDATGRHYGADIGAALLDGYSESYGLTPGERSLLPTLAQGASIRFALTRAWDWLNTPADALVTRKDPLAYSRRLTFYRDHGATLFA